MASFPGGDSSADSLHNSKGKRETSKERPTRPSLVARIRRSSFGFRACLGSPKKREKITPVMHATQQSSLCATRRLGKERDNKSKWILRNLFVGVLI